MSEVTILASALQSDTGDGAAVDVSAFSTLRLNFSALADQGRNPHLLLVIETAPHAVNGPWRVIHERRLSPNVNGPYAWDCAPHAVLSGFDNYVRARWAGSIVRTINEENIKFFTIGLAGDGKPDAA